MTTDIVTRLREFAEEQTMETQREEAADEIETLRAERDEALAKLSVAREALGNIIGCFDAAAFEGLSDRLDEQPPGETGSLRDLVERRLSYAFQPASEALSAIDSPNIVAQIEARALREAANTLSPNGLNILASDGPATVWQKTIDAIRKLAEQKEQGA